MEPQLLESTERQDTLVGRTVVMADDHELVLEGIARILQDDIQTALACANDGRTLVELVSEHHPDFVLVDISMPSMNGVEAIRRIRSCRAGNKSYCGHSA